MASGAASMCFFHGFSSFSIETTVSDSHGHAKKPLPYEPIMGPGVKPGEMATDYDQAVGLERLEYLANTHGINIFHDDPLPDYFGTMKEPRFVEAYGDHRIVGCTGR